MRLLICILISVFALAATAQDRIRGPDFMPWIRRTVDLTNHVPKTFRCSYKKRCKEAFERLTRVEHDKKLARGKMDVHKKALEKKPVKSVGEN